MPLEVTESDRREGRVATEPLSVEESRFGPDAPGRPTVGGSTASPPTTRWVAPVQGDVLAGGAGRAGVAPEPALETALDHRGWSLRKLSGHRWVPVLGSPLERGGVRVGPHEGWARRHRIENVPDLPVLGPGLYARTREVRLEDGTTGGTPVSVGALFAVEGPTTR